MKMNDEVMKFFDLILDAFNENGINIHETGNEAIQDLGYSFDGGDDDLSEEMSATVLKTLLQLNDSKMHSFSLVTKDNAEDVTVHSEYGDFAFEFVHYGDVNFKYLPEKTPILTEVEITVTEIEVVKFTNQKGAGSGGHDTVSLVTNLPSGTFPYEGFARLKIEIAKGQIDAYLARNFPNVKVNTINV